MDMYAIVEEAVKVEKTRKRGRRGIVSLVSEDDEDSRALMMLVIVWMEARRVVSVSVRHLSPLGVSDLVLVGVEGPVLERRCKRRRFKNMRAQSRIQ